MTRIEELKKMIDDLETKRFMNLMKDRWTDKDYKYDENINLRIIEVENELRTLGVEIDDN